MVLPSFLDIILKGRGRRKPLPSGDWGSNRPISTILANHKNKYQVLCYPTHLDFGRIELGVYVQYPTLLINYA